MTYFVDYLFVFHLLYWAIRSTLIRMEKQIEQQVYRLVTLSPLTLAQIQQVLANVAAQVNALPTVKIRS